MNVMGPLAVLRDRLALIPGIASCKIGMEANICPDDYPLIRLVPTRITGTQQQNTQRVKVECLVYFGDKINNFDDVADDDGYTGLEKTYNALLKLEDAIRNTQRYGDGLRYTWTETITDEDQLTTYKLMAVRCEFEG